uniref:Uncharacterized protein n=1 Tax=Arundo donax TaxID=35708 RepID=A0A0A9HS61_ARUDO
MRDWDWMSSFLRSKLMGPICAFCWGDQRRL